MNTIEKVKQHIAVHRERYIRVGLAASIDVGKMLLHARSIKVTPTYS